MTNKIQLITILTLATVLITGGFGLTPFAYSTNNDHDNKDNKWKLWKLSYDEHDDEEHDDDDGKDDDDDDCKDDDDDDGKDDDDDDCKDDDDDEDDDEQGEDPATITIINNVASDTQPFDITVLPNVSEEIIDSTTKKYTVDSHTTVKILGDPDRPILITGDGNCPENNGGFVNIEKGQNITCIYDDRPVGQAGPSPTVTLKVKVIDVELGVSETSPPSFQVNGEPALLNVQIQVVANEATEITQ